MQQCTLLSIKTGGCSEDCSYCPQSSRYDTGVKAQKLLSEDIVLDAAKKVSFLVFLVLAEVVIQRLGPSSDPHVQSSFLMSAFFSMSIFAFAREI